MLKAAGIVEDEKRGSMVFYRLRTQCVVNFFDCIESVIGNAKTAVFVVLVVVMATVAGVGYGMMFPESPLLEVPGAEPAVAVDLVP